MTEDWKLPLRTATDALKTIASDDAAKNAQLTHNITTARSLRDDVIAPALDELREELERNGTPATIERGETEVSSPNRGFYGSLTVNLDAFLSGSSDAAKPTPGESTFFYAFSVEAGPHDLAYDNEFYIVDRGNRIEIIAEDYEELPDTAEAPSREDIKRDFARKYLFAVQAVQEQRATASS